MPQFMGLPSFQMIEDEGWIFDPLPWIVELFEGQESLIRQARRAVDNSVSTIAVHDARVLAIGGLTFTRWWKEKPICAEAWTFPCKEALRWPKFIFKWAKEVHNLQRSYEIPRIEAYTVLDAKGVYTEDNHRAAQFLNRLGFSFEGHRHMWFRGRTAQAFALCKSDFRPLNKLH